MGLYHDRSDRPARNDRAWFCHLNVRKGGRGQPEFVKRPVAPYVVPVAEFEARNGTAAEVVIQAAGLPADRQPATTASRSATDSAGTRSPRILELLRLAEANPSLAEMQPYLSDPDARVRRAAMVTLTEILPEGAGLALATAAQDSRGAVRHAAVTGLRELAGVLPADAGLQDALATASGSPDAVVRAAVLDVLRQLRLGDAAAFGAGLATQTAG